MTKPLQNFRGWHALVAHPDDRNRAVLLGTMAMLGLQATAVDLAAGESVPAGRIDIAFLDVDGVAGLPWAPGEVPIVAVIGHESPSRLQRAFELEPHAFLLKPVRPSGIFTAIFFAANGHARDRQLARTLHGLAARHQARRLVMKAVLRVMDRFGVDDDEAFRRMRKESMRLRVTVEELSSRIVAGEDGPAPARDRLAGRA